MLFYFQIDASSNVLHSNEIVCRCLGFPRGFGRDYYSRFVSIFIRNYSCFTIHFILLISIILMKFSSFLFSFISVWSHAIRISNHLASSFCIFQFRVWLNPHESRIPINRKQSNTLSLQRKFHRQQLHMMNWGFYFLLLSNANQKTKPNKDTRIFTFVVLNWKIVAFLLFTFLFLWFVFNFGFRFVSPTKKPYFFWWMCNVFNSTQRPNALS